MTNGMRYRIINKDGHGICPKCAGMLMRDDPLTLKCFDCRTRFKAVDLGIFDAEMEYIEDAE